MKYDAAAKTLYKDLGSIDTRTSFDRADSGMESVGIETDLLRFLGNSMSDDNMTRINSIPELGRFMDDERAQRRIREMLNDEVVTMQVDAAEVLVRCGGTAGLLSVLEELGRRHNEPDVDYIAYRLYELDASGEFPVIDNATAIQRELSPNGSVGFQDLKRLRGQ